MLDRRTINDNSKYHSYFEKRKFPEWCQPPCSKRIHPFAAAELEVTNNVASIVDELPAEKPFDMMPSKNVGRAFDGSEKRFARSQNDYYLSQVAVGDPIRAKRTKRTLRDESVLSTQWQ